MGIDIPLAVHLQGSHKAYVQPSVVVQIELVCHVVHGGRPYHGSERLPRDRKASDASGLNCKSHHIQHAVFSSVSGHHLRDPDPDIDDIVHPQLLGRPSADDIAGCAVAPRLCGYCVYLLIPRAPLRIGNLKASCQRSVSLVPLLRLHYHDGVNQAARDNGIPRP